MKTNKQLIESKIESIGMTLGIWDNALDNISKKELKKVTDNLEQGSNDIEISISRHKFVLEIIHCDNEIDFNVMSHYDYECKYGRAYGEEDN